MRNLPLESETKPQSQNKLLTPEAKILLALAAKEMTASELHSETGLAFSTLYPNLAELERDGLIVRVNKHYRLTKAGYDALRRLDDLIHSYLGPR